MLLSNIGSYSLGCEITDRAIKIVQLKKSGITPRVVTLGHTRLKEGIIKNGKIENFDALTRAFASAVVKVRGKKIITKEATFSLPDSQTFIKTISLVRREGKSLVEQIQEEIKKHFPLDTSEAYFDWQVLNQKGSKMDVIISAVADTVAAPYIELSKKIGWHLIALEPESIAISRAILGKDIESNSLIIDLGYTHSSLIVVANRTVQFTLSLPISGTAINETIAHKLKLTIAQAEKARIKCGLDEKKCKGALKLVLNSILDDLAFKIQDAIDYYNEHTAKHAGTLQKIIITGGGAHLQNIDKVLAMKLKRSVEKSDVAKFIKKLDKKTFPQISKIDLYTYDTPIGLALRNIFERFL